jgi:hypothetical protein
MNEQKNTDFFPVISERDAHLVAPEIFEPYQETEEDRLHEKRLREIEAQIDERLGATSTVEDDELGELPYDAEADRKRWDELEKDFERVFDEAEKINF